MEDAQGALWLATPAGLSVVRGKQFRNVVPGGPLLIDFVVTLCEGRTERSGRAPTARACGG